MLSAGMVTEVLPKATSAMSVDSVTSSFSNTSLVVVVVEPRESVACCNAWT